MIVYVLPGNIAYQQRLYPDPKLLDPGLDLKTYEDVIRCFTAASLTQDGIRIRDGSLSVVEGSGGYTISFDPDSSHVDAARAVCRDAPRNAGREAFRPRAQGRRSL